MIREKHILYSNIHDYEIRLKNTALNKLSMMRAKIKTTAVMLTIIIVLLCFTVESIKIAHPQSTGGNIDLFTQKEPYSGKGPNTPSDAFHPEEIVCLYAFVTYRGVPVENLPVAFNVLTPSNKSFTLTSRTNAGGIATTNFTIFTPPINVDKSEVFGDWFAQANVLIDGVIFQDNLTFKVDWIIQLLSVRIINENLENQTYFGIGGDVGFEICMKNIAMSFKNVTLGITIQDELEVPINFYMIPDLEAQPNETLIFIYCKLAIPKWAHVGWARVYISALTSPVSENGVPYCPSIYNDFFITIDNPLIIHFHDVAVVRVEPSATSVEIGQSVDVRVDVRNEGTELENFGVALHCGVWLIEKKQVELLEPYSKTTLTFTINTSSFPAGNYTLIASISPISNETDLSDNVLIDGILNVRTPEKLFYLDIKTDPPGIVEISGEGWYDEFTNVTLNATQYVFIFSNVRYRFSYWDIDGTPVSGNPISVFMDVNHTATAHYVCQYYLDIKTDPPGIVEISGEGWYDEYSNVSLIAPTIENYNFEYWDVNDMPQGIGISNINVFMNMPKNATAHYTQIIMYTLNITASRGGTTDPIPGTYTYAAGSYVEVRAIPDYDYVFDHWELDGVNVGSDNPYVVLMDEDHTLKAVFSPAVAGWFIPEWFYWLLFLLILFLIALMGILLYRRRRKKFKEAFSSGWTAWYYGYNLRNKDKKF